MAQANVGSATGDIELPEVVTMKENNLAEAIILSTYFLQNIKENE